MRAMIKTANRLDTFWSMFLLMPAVIVMINAGIAMKEGHASGRDVGYAAGAVVEKAIGQYAPYVKGTSGAILAGTNKLSSVTGSCFSKKGPIYLQPGQSNHCALKSFFPASNSIRPFGSY